MEIGGGIGVDARITAVSNSREPRPLQIPSLVFTSLSRGPNETLRTASFFPSFQASRITVAVVSLEFTSAMPVQSNQLADGTGSTHSCRASPLA